MKKQWNIIIFLIKIIKNTKNMKEIYVYISILRLNNDAWNYFISDLLETDVYYNVL